MSDWYCVDGVEQIPSPNLLVYPDRIIENIQRMLTIFGGAPSKLRPHVKTHKMPDVVKLQLELGVSKFKTATISEAEMTALAGAADVLIAYPIVGPNIDRMIALTKKYPKTRFAGLADDARTIDRIDEIAKVNSVHLNFLVDLNVGMNRTGIAPSEEAFKLYQQIAKASNLVVAGLHVYDGHLHESDPVALANSVDEAYAPVWQLSRRLSASGFDVPVIVAGGTPTSALLAKHEGVEVGAGTTVLWDAGQPKLSPGLEMLNAAVLLCRIVSRPTPETLCVDLGYKAVASEFAPPRVRFFGLENAEFVMQSEEHLVLRTDKASDYPVGTVIYGIPYHVCPTVALYEYAWCVRHGKATERWPVEARKREIDI